MPETEFDDCLHYYLLLLSRSSEVCSILARRAYNTRCYAGCVFLHKEVIDTLCGIDIYLLKNVVQPT